MTPNASPPITLWTHTAATLQRRMPALERFVYQGSPAPLSRHPAWSNVLKQSLGHEIYALEARSRGETCGFLPLAFVNTMLFGRFLVSMPYLNSNGVIANSPDVETLLVGRAVELAEELDCKNLELRQERFLEHPRLNGALTSKIHMRRPLPEAPEALWKELDPKVRNQIRKGEKNGFDIRSGGEELLEPFYAVLSENMRDLGTPVYGRELFRTILQTFPNDAELVVVHAAEKPIACALLLHGPGITEVPTASSLREYNSTCANMLMYHRLLVRAIGRGQSCFDFGRSTQDGPTYKFKKQWGAKASPAIWQYCVRAGDSGEMRPDNPRYERMIRIWQKLPLRLTQYLGPTIVRGIP
jgi:FemAB-related protein (PEP-CTERM system-associated)